jgi:hypothetical protein
MYPSSAACAGPRVRAEMATRAASAACWKAVGRRLRYSIGMLVDAAVRPYDTAPDTNASDMPHRAPYTSISGPHSKPPTSCASEKSDCIRPYCCASAPKLRAAGRVVSV